MDKDLKSIKNFENENNKTEIKKEIPKPDIAELNLLYERISVLEKENKKLNEDLSLRDKENKDLTSSNQNLQEEINFIKNKSATYLKSINESHKHEKDKLLESISKLEDQMKINAAIEINETNYSFAQLKKNEQKLIQSLKECEAELAQYKAKALQINQEKPATPMANEKYIEEVVRNLNIVNQEKNRAIEEKNTLIKVFHFLLSI